MAMSYLLSIFPAMMVVAAFSDLFTMTISNRISLALIGTYLIMAISVSMPLNAIFDGLVCGLFVLIVSFGLFCRGWIGGGDAKLAAATAIWMGWSFVLDYVLAGTILGGFLTLTLLSLRAWPLPGFMLGYQWIERLHDRDTGVPYGIALAAAGLMIYPTTDIYLRALT
jgi:prepilin peptidase CpaA